jgi:hypothetical protein
MYARDDSYIPNRNAAYAAAQSKAVGPVIPAPGTTRTTASPAYGVAAMQTSASSSRPPYSNTVTARTVDDSVLPDRMRYRHGGFDVAGLDVPQYDYANDGNRYYTPGQRHAQTQRRYDNPYRNNSYNQRLAGRRSVNGWSGANGGSHIDPCMPCSEIDASQGRRYATNVYDRPASARAYASYPYGEISANGRNSANTQCRVYPDTAGRGRGYGMGQSQSQRHPQTGWMNYNVMRRQGTGLYGDDVWREAPHDPRYATEYDRHFTKGPDFIPNGSRFASRGNTSVD